MSFQIVASAWFENRYNKGSRNDTIIYHANNINRFLQAFVYDNIRSFFSKPLVSQPSGTCYAQFQAPPTFYVCIYVCTFQLNIHIAKDSIIYTFQHSKSITNPFMHIHCVSKSKCGSVSLIKISRNFINQNFNEQTLTLIDNRSLSKKILKKILINNTS